MLDANETVGYCCGQAQEDSGSEGTDVGILYD